MKAFILAAGKGTRLRPLTADCPKAMLPIGGTPLLEHLIGWLRRHGVVDLVINLHHEPEAITRRFGTGRRFGVSIAYSYEEHLLGTAGAVKKRQWLFDDAFLVIYGDVFTNLDLARFVAFHAARRPTGRVGPAVGPHAGGPYGTLSLYHVDNPSARGLVEISADGCLTRFVEKPPPDQVFTDLASAGVMVLEPGILDYVPDGVPYDFAHDLFPVLLRLGVPLYGEPLRGDEFLIDIGSSSSYRQAQERWESLRRPIGLGG